MPLDPQELKGTLQNIVNDINIVADIAAGVDPALIPFIAIGRAIDKEIPGLAATVAGWIEGDAPSQSDLDQKAQDLAVLGNKEGI